MGKASEEMRDVISLETHAKVIIDNLRLGHPVTDVDVSVLSRASRLYPDDYGYALHFFQCMVERGSMQEADFAMQKVIAMPKQPGQGPEDPLFHYIAADLMRWKGHPLTANEYLKRAEERKPAQRILHMIHLKAGEIMQKMHEYDYAIAHFSAVAQDEEVEERLRYLAYCKMAMCHDDTGNKTAAVDALEHAVAFNQHDDLLCMKLSRLLDGIGDRDKALEAARMAFDRATRNGDEHRVGAASFQMAKLQHAKEIPVAVFPYLLNHH